MIPGRRRGVILIEPGINPVTRRFSLPNVANYPPLPQARLAGQLGQAEDVEIADLRIAGEKERLLDRVRRDPPGLAGISLTFTSNGDEAIGVAAAIRSVSPATTIVLGGTAPSEDPASFWDSAADLICFRNGDAAFAALAAEIREAGRAPTRFPGFFHRDDGRWVLDPGPPVAPLASLYPCAWHLLPKRYWREYFQGFRPTGMGQTSEGCPYDCTFCTVWKTHGRKVSLASLANVQHDFNSLPPAIRAFFFADDIWMQASERQIQELYDPLLEWMASDFLPRRGDFWLTVETRTDLYLREEDRFKAWIRRGALKRILFGVEAVTDDQLKSFSKRNTVDKNIEAIRRAAETGAIVTAQFVIPCDATRAYFDEMVRFLKAHRRWIRTSNFTVATPLPGTDLYAESLKESPELADRSAVSHPAFSLFTALTPTRLDVREFYEQVARVFRAANQMYFSLDAERQALRMVFQSPWLIRRLAKAPLALRALTDPGTFLDVHRLVQGDRLLGPRAVT
ncbi:MAG TPA: radical SAM protein [Candidatus Polarisedimenticolia bacterium]|jgi:magnesium-protoporphyrin IX monomethyl ester (oxidative) cyclase|nr:radical SAM protein [Candidatus Polarisedimenticolia bacterium]